MSPPGDHHAGLRPAPPPDDLRALMSVGAGLPADEAVDLACADLIDRWRLGQRVPAEAYAPLHPALAADGDRILDLVDCEVAMRAELGERPSVEEYAWRFPAHAEALGRQFALDGLVALEAPVEPTAGRVGAPPGERTEPSTDVGPDPRWPRIAGFVLEAELGRGGMGVVYRARQVGLRRVVALKMILAAGEADSVAGRFRAEAEAVARLQHPNVVQVHAVGEHDGRPFLVLEYLAGGSLAGRLDGAPRPPREAAALILGLARGIERAHAAGVVHRDLKPANVLLDADGTPKVADFGLAKLLDDDSDLTRTGTLLGSPSYMAPEQAGGGEVGPAADLHALGVLLYELLTGRPPFRAATVAETLEQVREAEPVPPGRLVPGLPRDLETICLVCLRKEPARRYASASALADDLGRFLDGRSILARRTGPVGRAGRWARRNPLAAGLLAALALALSGGLAVVTALWLRADEGRQAALAATGAAVRSRAESQRLSARLALDRGLALAESGDPGAGLLWMLQALRGLPAGEADFERMVRANLDGWARRVHTPRCVVATTSVVTAVALSDDGRALALGGLDGSFGVWDAADGRPILPPSRIGSTRVSALRFAPDGNTLAVGHGDGPEIRLVEVATGRTAGRIGLGGIGPPWSARFDADGRTLWVIGSDGSARFDLDTGRSLAVPGPASRLAVLLDPGADGRRLGLAVAREGPDRVAATVVDVGSGRVLGPAFRLLDRHRPVALTPGGRTLLTVDSQEFYPLRSSELQFWDTASGASAGDPLPLSVEVGSYAISPDGLTLAVGCSDELVRFYAVATRRPVGSPIRNGGSVSGLAFSADGRSLLTAAHDGSARLWDLGELGPSPANGEGGPSMPDPARPMFLQYAAARFDRAGGVVALGGTDSGVARLVEAATGRPVGAPMLHPRQSVRTMAFDPAGRRLATVNIDPAVVPTLGRIWDAATGRPLTSPMTLPNHVRNRALAFAPDGSWLAAGDYSDGVEIRDAATGSRRARLMQEDIVLSLAISPDGTRIAAAMASDRRQAPHARVWDATTGRPVGSPLPHPSSVWDVAFRPDGGALLTATGLASQLWDLATGDPIGAPFPAHDGAFAWLPDGRLLAAARDRTIRLRDGQTGRAVGPPMALRGAATSLVVDAAGAIAAAGMADGTVAIWDLATSRPLGPPVGLPARVHAVAIAADGRSFAAAAGDGTVRSWPMPEARAGSLADLEAWIEALTGRRLDDQQAVELLEQADLAAARSRATGPGLLDREPPARRHARLALEAEADGDPVAALWHLDRLGPGGDPADFALRRAAQLVALGRHAEAAAEVDAARRVEAPERVGWHLEHLSAEARVAGRPGEALWFLDRAAEANPDAWAVHASRADLLHGLGRRGDRDAALARFAATAPAAEAAAWVDLDAALAGAGRPADLALAAAERLGEAHPDDPNLRRARSAARVALGRAAEALPDLDAELAADPADLELRLRHALLLLDAGCLDAYHRSCVEALGRLAPGASPGTRNLTAWLCSVGPPPAGARSTADVVALAEQAVDASPPGPARGAALNTLGAALVRAGRPSEAILRLEEGIRASGGKPYPQDWALLALAHHALGLDAEARRLRGNLALASDADPWTALEVALLRREVDAALFPDLPADPFAR